MGSCLGPSIPVGGGLAPFLGAMFAIGVGIGGEYSGHGPVVPAHPLGPGFPVSDVLCPHPPTEPPPPTQIQPPPNHHPGNLNP